MRLIVGLGSAFLLGFPDLKDGLSVHSGWEGMYWLGRNFMAVSFHHSVYLCLRSFAKYSSIPQDFFGLSSIKPA